MFMGRTHFCGPRRHTGVGQGVSGRQSHGGRGFTVLEDLGCDREDRNGAVARRNEKMKEGIVLWFLFMVCLF